MSRFRDLLERLLYTGMKPGGAQSAPPPSPASDGMRWLGPLRGPVERILSGGASPNDPLYLSNRSTGRKILAWCAIGVPLAAMVTVLFLVASGQFSKPAAQKDEFTAVASTVLPSFKDVQIKVSQDVVVLDARVDSRANPVTLSGTVKNVTSHKVQAAEIVFDLTDNAGLQLGGFTVIVQNIAPEGTAKFAVAVPIKEAKFALLRSVYSR